MRHAPVRVAERARGQKHLMEAEQQVGVHRQREVAVKGGGEGGRERGREGGREREREEGRERERGREGDGSARCGIIVNVHMFHMKITEQCIEHLI
jgi:hypothetical protein